MTQQSIDKGRRNAMRAMLGGLAAVPLAQLVGVAVAQAADPKRIAEDDPMAKSLQYRHDATKAQRVDKPGHPGTEQYCYNCQLLKGDSGEWRPCYIFGDDWLVNENGWCTAWAPRAGT